MAISTSRACGYLDLGQSEVATFIDILHASNPLVVCHQSKPILQLSLVAGIEPKFRYFDLAQAHFIIDAEKRHDLATIIEEYLNHRLATPAKGVQGTLLGEMSDDEVKLHGERAQAIRRVYPM